MQAHFSSFTPEWAQAFGHELAADIHNRREFLDETRNSTRAILANFRHRHHEAEAQRRQRATQEADGRRVFMSELRSGVHALKERFELDRREIATNFSDMAADLRAACEVFRNRNGHQAKPYFIPAAQPETATDEPPGFQAPEGSRSRHAHGDKAGKRRRG